MPEIAVKAVAATGMEDKLCLLLAQILYPQSGAPICAVGLWLAQHVEFLPQVLQNRGKLRKHMAIFNQPEPEFMHGG